MRKRLLMTRIDRIRDCSSSASAGRDDHRENARNRFSRTRGKQEFSAFSSLLLVLARSSRNKSFAIYIITFMYLIMCPGYGTIHQSPRVCLFLSDTGIGPRVIYSTNYKAQRIILCFYLLKKLYDEWGWRKRPLRACDSFIIQLKSKGLHIIIRTNRINALWELVSLFLSNVDLNPVNYTREIIVNADLVIIFQALTARD